MPIHLLCVPSQINAVSLVFVGIHKQADIVLDAQTLFKHMYAMLNTALLSGWVPNYLC